MVHPRVSDEYIHFSLMYSTHYVFTVISMKHLVNQDREPTMPQELSTGTKPSVSNLCVLFCTYVVQNSNAYVDTKALNMYHQSQTSFRGIFVGISQHQKG